MAAWFRPLFYLPLLLLSLTLLSSCSCPPRPAPPIASAHAPEEPEETLLGSSPAISAPESSPSKRTTLAVPSFLKRKTAVPLERDYRSYFARTQLNGSRETRLLFDTGAAYVTIHRGLAQELGLNLRGAEPVTCLLADGSHSVAHRTRLPQMKLGDATVRNVDVLILPNPPTPTHEGLLGMSFLENYVFELDTRTSTLWLKNRPRKTASGPRS